MRKTYCAMGWTNNHLPLSLYFPSLHSSRCAEMKIHPLIRIHAAGGQIGIHVKEFRRAIMKSVLQSRKLFLMESCMSSNLP